MASLCDINFWLALVFEGHPHHSASVSWWSACDFAESLLFCRVTQSGFLRVSTNPTFLRNLALKSRTNTEAWESYELIRRDGRIQFAAEPADIDAVWTCLSRRDGQSSNLWTDTYLAAFAIAGRYRFVTFFVTFDQDFCRFKADGLNLELLTS